MLEAKGNLGRVVLDEDTVHVYFQSHHNAIPISEITGIRFIPPTFSSAGVIQFCTGPIDHTQPALQVVKDVAHALGFRYGKKKTEKFMQFRDAVQARIDQYTRENVPQGVSPEDLFLVVRSDGYPFNVTDDAVIKVYIRQDPDSVLIAQRGSDINISIPYDEILLLEFAGPGTVKMGGNLIGGGFGLAGAAVGIAAASAINAATRKTYTISLLTIGTQAGSLTLATNTLSPEGLRLKLATVVARTKAGRERVPQSEVAERSIADELGKLAELKASGLLTDEEFEAAKRRLLEHE